MKKLISYVLAGLASTLVGCSTLSGPEGYLDYCRNSPTALACSQTGQTGSNQSSKVFSVDDLKSVNDEVNHSIKYQSDEAQYGKFEFWTIPKKYGDCEDYVLLKIEKLVARGFPLKDLRIAVTEILRVTYTSAGRPSAENHVLLVARLDSVGKDYILDNVYPDVWEPNQTPWKIHQIQSEGGSTSWKSY